MIRWLRLLCAAFATWAQLVFVLAAAGAAPQFNVYCVDPTFGRQVAERAVQLRRSLAVEWLGAEMAPWSRPCTVRVVINPSLRRGGGGTSFSASGISMQLNGPRERLLADILPHEVMHTVIHTRFRGHSIPRWIDEGICTIVESQWKIDDRSYRDLRRFLQTGQGIPTNLLVAYYQYPPNMNAFYAQSSSMTHFLEQLGGKRRLITFLGRFLAGAGNTRWTKAIQDTYKLESLSDFQETWLSWVKAGSPQAIRGGDQLLCWDGTRGVFQICRPWNPYQPQPTVYPPQVVIPEPTQPPIPPRAEPQQPEGLDPVPDSGGDAITRPAPDSPSVVNPIVDKLIERIHTEPTPILEKLIESIQNQPAPIVDKLIEQIESDPDLQDKLRGPPGAGATGTIQGIVERIRDDPQLQERLRGPAGERGPQGDGPTIDAEALAEAVARKLRSDPDFLEAARGPAGKDADVDLPRLVAMVQQNLEPITVEHEGRVMRDGVARVGVVRTEQIPLGGTLVIRPVIVTKLEEGRTYWQIRALGETIDLELIPK